MGDAGTTANSIREHVWSSTPVVNGTPYKQKRDNGFELDEHPIDQYRSLRVAEIGAGISGTDAGVLLPAKVPRIQLTIYEKNSDIGGTWAENIYPGVRCDVPAHAYQSTFSPNTQWSEEFAQGAEIRDYWRDFGKRHGVYQYTKFNTRVDRAEWTEGESSWKLTVKNLVSREPSEQSFDFLLTAIGLFNDWKFPDYPGLEDYKGHLRHSSNWDPNFDPTGKRIAVIGNGASGIQVFQNYRKWRRTSTITRGQGRG
jgi:cation diffusion facilitator CzcD-associated flavoprotein CzcO